MSLMSILLASSQHYLSSYHPVVKSCSTAQQAITTSANLSLLCALAFLSGLSIDYTANKLYWISSANGTINRCNLDGSGLEVLETLKKQLAKGSALAVMGEWSLSGEHQMAVGD